MYPCHLASAFVSVVWDSPIHHSTNDGGVNYPVFPVFFTVNDTSLAGNGQNNTIQVLVNSTSYQAGIILTLKENPSDDGIFKNTNLIFTNGQSEFNLLDTVNVSLNNTDGNNDPNQVEFIPNTTNLPAGLVVMSTTDQNGIQFFLKETGPNTGIFANPLQITSGPSITNSSIQANPGDIVSVYNFDSGQMQNWLIIPNSDTTLGALPAKFNDKVTAIYNGVKGQTLIDTAAYVGDGGGGGGGLIQPGLVLDFVSGIIGGSPYIVQPPSFGGGYLRYSDGLTFTQGTNTTTLDISKYNQELPQQVMVAGNKVTMTFKTYESYNSKGVIHMGLFIIPRGQDMITPNSIASIQYDKYSPVEINDPNHNLANTTVSSTSDGKFQYTQFSFVPTKSYAKMSFLVRAWNDHLYSTDIRVHDDLILPSTPKILPSGVDKYESFNDLQSLLEKDKFYKPQIMAHIHSTTDVFGSGEGGKVYWLYDNINHSVTLVVADKDDNELSKVKQTLEQYVEKKGDYGFMKFTFKQLNRWDEKQEESAKRIEAAKALFAALEKN